MIIPQYHTLLLVKTILSILNREIDLIAFEVVEDAYVIPPPHNPTIPSMLCCAVDGMGRPASMTLILQSPSIISIGTPFSRTMNFTALCFVVALMLSATSGFQLNQEALNCRPRNDLSLSAVSRRQWVALTSATVAGFGLGIDPVFAEELEMKEFVDPQGLFSLRVPKNFFTLRRTQKGDLPDAKTGKGRRGSSIFTAGNMAKAEVVAVERYPTRVLLEENGIDASGDLSTFTAIGEPKAVASLIILRREKDTPNQGAKILGDVKVSDDGKELCFRLKTEIDVQKPDLLMEQSGVSQLFRITLAKATLNSNDGNIMAVFGSALEQDFDNGTDGPALEETVKSFVAIEQPVAA